MSESGLSTVKGLTVDEALAGLHVNLARQREVKTQQTQRSLSSTEGLPANIQKAKLALEGKLVDKLYFGTNCLFNFGYDLPLRWRIIAQKEFPTMKPSTLEITIEVSDTFMRDDTFSLIDWLEGILGQAIDEALREKGIVV